MPRGLFFGCRRNPRINVGEFGDLPESGGCSGDERLKIDTGTFLDIQFFLTSSPNLPIINSDFAWAANKQLIKREDSLYLWP